MSNYLLGIDLGTSSVRAGLFTKDGRCAAVGSENYPILTPKPGYAEHDPPHLVESHMQRNI